MSSPRPLRPRHSLLAAAALALLLAACRAPAVALGHSQREAAAHADTLALVLQARFGPHERDERFDAIRPKIAEHALTPSRIFDEKSLWTASSRDSRVLDLAGSGTPGQYQFGVAPSPEPIAQATETRGHLQLTHLDGDVYEWMEQDELAVGSITGDDLSRALGALFAAADGMNEWTARAAYRTELPRTTAALAELFSLDTLHLAPNPEGGTDVRLVIGIHPDRFAPHAPHYAKYIDEYVRPTELRASVYDDAGHEWWRIDKTGDEVAITLRVRDSSLAPLAGPPERIPDRVHVRVAVSTKAWIFHMGLENLVGDVTLTGAPHEKGFVARFTHEPNWNLPPLVERMLRTPLRRPFAGNGAMLSFAVRDDVGGQTLSVREFELTVEESQIMRWFGGLGNSAVSEFRKGAEDESDRYTASVFAALRLDLAALTGGGAPIPASTSGSPEK